MIRTPLGCTKNMDKLNLVITIVANYYAKKNSVIDWNGWVFEGHNKIVAKWVEDIAKKYKFDVKSVLAAAYLHDLAYAWTSKNDPDLDEKSEIEARKVLKKAGYSEEQVTFIVDKIIHGHGMHDGRQPECIEAKVLATADALSHFTTDFYLVMCWNHYLFENCDLAKFKAFVLKKIERDLNNKIFFEEYRKLALPYYNSLKLLFTF